MNAHFMFKPVKIDDIVNFFYTTTSMLHGRRIVGIAQASYEAAIIKLVETLRREELEYQVRISIKPEEAFKYLYM